MKIQARQIETFVKNPDPKARVILIYGPDDGLVRERATIIGKKVVPDLNDAFNVSNLTSDEIMDDPARLSDEANAISMMGGDRLVRITDGTDKISPYLKEYLENPSDTALIVIEASNLTPRSPLRKICEASASAAALPCYVDDARNAAGLIRETLSHAGYNCPPDVAGWLANNLTGNRQKIRSELEKLILYLGPPPNYQGPEGERANTQMGNVRMEDALTCCGEVGTSELDDLVQAVANKKPELAAKNYDKLLQEGVPVIMILRVLQNHFRRLHITKARIENGDPLEIAMKSLSPPVFFKQVDAFKAQVSRNSTNKLETILSKLCEVEAKSKQTGYPVETLCGQTLLGIAMSR